MIVFKDHRDYQLIDDFLNTIRRYLIKIEVNCTPDYSALTSLLLETAEFETGITDVFSPDVDNITYPVKISHEMTIASANLVYDAWKEKNISQNQVMSLKKSIAEIVSINIQDKIPVCIPEGYAFYGLCPEMYLEAAEEFFDDKAPNVVTCIGLRTIGTSLCAIVDVALKRRNSDVLSITLRPKGHPFKRTIEISTQIRTQFLQRKNGWFAVIDEGPGLSGSSIGGTLEMLLELGIPMNRIVVFPSWLPAANSFICKKARELWPKVKKFSKDFSDVWIKNKKLERFFNKNIEYDLSAGNWRWTLLKEKEKFPPVYIHHERRKFLLKDSGNHKYIAKWVGLGKYGEKLIERARMLAEYNLGPIVDHIVNGFLIVPFIQGWPISSSFMNETFMDFASKYFAFVKNKFPARLSVPYEKMEEMIHNNIEEGLGGSYLEKISKRINCSKDWYESDIVGVDGKVMPYEWIIGREKIWKVDQLEHHCDQFFPGCQNILWDIAAFSIEFNLDLEIENKFFDHFIAISKEKRIHERMPFYKTAYLAFKLGYVTIAAESLSGTEDCEQFMKEKERYKKKLIDQLEK